MKQLIKSTIKQGLKGFGLELHRLPREQEIGDKSFYSCPSIVSFVLELGKGIRLCCERIDDIPQIALGDDPKETLEKIVGARALVIREGKTGGGLYPGCQRCSRWRKADWGNIENGFIHGVALSIYPSPCQCRCIYCDVIHKGLHKGTETVEAKATYEKYFSVIKLALEEGLIAKDATWNVATGEFTIHPYHDQIMELVEGRNAVFFTNCFKYDEDIARTLRTVPGSRIHLSIDSGTSETWHKVKGFHNFDEVVLNLKKYSEQSIHPEQITLKYILMPGINDNQEDYEGLMRIMQDLQIKRLSITRDERTKYGINPEDRKKLINSATQFVSVCQKNGITYDMSYDYFPEERKEIEALATKIVAEDLQ